MDGGTPPNPDHPARRPRRCACATSMDRASPLSSAPRQFSSAPALRAFGVRSAVGCGTLAAAARRAAATGDGAARAATCPTTPWTRAR
eukprot:14211810-Alexandrium_andersonii.AAC.1